MKGLTDRRAVLMAAGTAAAAAVAGTVAAQAGDIRGTIEYEGGIEIPKGRLVVTVEGRAEASTARPASEAQVQSDGKLKKMQFTVPSAAKSFVSPATEIVARLEREDGWLLARGSAPFADGAPVEIVLYTAMY